MSGAFIRIKSAFWADIHHPKMFIHTIMINDFFIQTDYNLQVKLAINGQNQVTTDNYCFLINVEVMIFRAGISLFKIHP